MEGLASYRNGWEWAAEGIPSPRTRACKESHIGLGPHGRCIGGRWPPTRVAPLALLAALTLTFGCRDGRWAVPLWVWRCVNVLRSVATVLVAPLVPAVSA
jgi:hypothetical protein